MELMPVGSGDLLASFIFDFASQDVNGKQAISLDQIGQSLLLV